MTSFKNALYLLFMVLCFAYSATAQTGEAPAANAKLNYPYSTAPDNKGNIYISDSRNQRICKVNLASGMITTIAGTGKEGFTGDGGPASKAQLSYPSGLAIDGKGNLYIADGGNNRIRKIDFSTGKISTVAGSGTKFGFGGDGGPATTAKLFSPDAIAFDAKNNLYFTDCGNNRVRKIDAATGTITTVAGSGVKGHSGDGGPAKSAKLYLDGSPVLSGLAIDKNGNLYISGTANRVRKVNAATGIITTVASASGDGGFSGDGGPATKAMFFNPGGIAVDAKGNLYIVDQSNKRVRKVDAATGIVTTYAGNGEEGYDGDGGQATAAQLTNPEGVSVDAKGNLYINTSARVRCVDAASGVITSVAGAL